MQAPDNTALHHTAVSIRRSPEGLRRYPSTRTRRTRAHLHGGDFGAVAGETPAIPRVSPFASADGADCMSGVI